jgi:hypothetical protein
MAIEIMDAGSVIACALLIIPKDVGDPVEAIAARGITSVSSANPNTIVVTLDQEVDPLATKILTSLRFGFGVTISATPVVASLVGSQILIALNANAVNGLVDLLVLQIRGPNIIGINTIAPP